MEAIEPNSTEPGPESTIEKIEREILRIDRLVRSWSEDRSLRFDPAHVAEKKRVDSEKKQPEVVKSQTPARGIRLLVVFNLLLFLYPIGIVTLQAIGVAFSMRMLIFLLTVSLMLAAGGNLFLLSLIVRKNRMHSPGKRPQKARQIIGLKSDPQPRTR